MDAELNANDVRLTMGGEPTFVSIDDMDGAEWNTAALGPTKKLLAEDLLLRLKGRFAPGGLLHIGQGKWYPGEPLPRWALSCYWRKDGEPVWRDDALFGKETTTYGHGPAEAERFVRTLARHLGVDPDHAAPAYEDVWYYLWKEQRLPVNVDPLDNKLKDPNERKRLARLFGQGLNQVGGLRPAAALVGLRGPGGLEERALDLQGRAPLPDPRRLPHGLPPALRRAPLCAGVRAGPGAGAQPLRARLPPALTL